MFVVPLFGRLALHGTGNESDLFRFIVPMFVGGTAGFFIGLMKDRLLQSVQQFRSTLDAAPFGMLQCDGEGRILFANRAIGESLNLSEQ